MAAGVLVQMFATVRLVGEGEGVINVRAVVLPALTLCPDE